MYPMSFHSLLLCNCLAALLSSMSPIFLISCRSQHSLIMPGRQSSPWCGGSLPFACREVGSRASFGSWAGFSSVGPHYVGQMAQEYSFLFSLCSLCGTL